MARARGSRSAAGGRLLHRLSAWPLGIAALLATVVVADGVLIVVAQRNAPTLVTDDAYERGLRWQEVIDARAAAAALGWRAEVEVCPGGLDPAGCDVRYVLTDGAGRPVEGLEGTLTATRADDARFDAEAPARADGAGAYRFRLPLARPGLYRLSVRLEGGPSPWLDERRAFVPAAPEVVR